MKRLTKSLILLASSLALACYSQTNATPSQSFFQTALQYFDSFNTNLVTYHADVDRVDIYSGVENQEGIGMDALLAVHWNAIVPSANTRLFIGGVVRNADIAGTLLGTQADLGFSLVKFDAKLSFGVSPGYRHDTKRGYAEIFAEVSKAMTDHTFAGLRISHDLYWRGQRSDTPGVCVFAGFNF